MWAWIRPWRTENPKPTIAAYEKPEVRFPLPKLLDGLTEDEERSLQTFLVILRRFDGCTTPIEEFICTLVHDYGYRALKPDDFEDDIKTMKENWNDAVAIAQLFAQAPGTSGSGPGGGQLHLSASKPAG